MKWLLMYAVLLPPFAVAQFSTFKVMVVPDTQYEVRDSDTHAWLAAAATWACSNVSAVIGLGDITQNATTQEFTDSWTYFYGILDACGLPYLAAMGNHDYYSGWDVSHFNAVYGTASTYAGHGWYKGGYPANSNQNNYIEVTLGGQSLIFISLEYQPTINDETWAESIIAANPDKLVIAETHAYLVPDANGVATYEPGYGQAIWTNVFSQYANVVMVVCGHDWYDSKPIGSVWRDDAAADGHAVPQMLSDYQELGAGSGYMRILTITPTSSTGGTVVASTYSPWCASNPATCALGATLGNNNAEGNYHDVNVFSFSYGTAPQVGGTTSGSTGIAWGKGASFQ